MSTSINNYKRHPLYKRKKEIEQMKIEHPNRCAIFVGKLDSDGILLDVQKHKYLVPYDFTMAQFTHTIRRNMKLSPETALFLFINDIVATTHSQIGGLYEDYKSEDGFLYITYAGENTFG
jgi:GABA(A) receptor-associated protein